MMTYHRGKRAPKVSAPYRAYFLFVMFAGLASGQSSVAPDRPNVVAFAAQDAKFVRFVILAASRGQPCIDELEVYGPGSKQNLALASKGAKASASSCLPGYAKHRIPHLNDGRYGNDHSWISKDKSNEWAQIELPKPARIDRVVFSRDRKGHYKDRVPISFGVQVSLDGKQWRTVKRVAAAGILVPEKMVLLPTRPVQLNFAAQPAKFVRIVVRRTNTESQPCIDELEVFGDDLKTNLALASRGARPAASSCLKGYAIHKVEHLNDGKHQNAHSWIAADTKGEWAQVELAAPAKVRRVVFSRDRDGTYKDRMPTDFSVQLSLDGKAWTTVKIVTARDDVVVDEPLPDEHPKDWALRVAMALPKAMRKEADALAAKVTTNEHVGPLLDLLRLTRSARDMAKRLPLAFNPPALRRAVADMRETFGDERRLPADLDSRLAAYEQRLPALRKRLAASRPAEMRAAIATCEEVCQFARGVLLSNPLLDFDELLVLKRGVPKRDQSHSYWRSGHKYGMTVNWSCDFRPRNPPLAAWWDDEIAAMSMDRAEPRFRTVHKPKTGRLVQHPELHFDGDRLVFCMPGPKNAFQVFEINIDGTGLRQITTDTGPDVDNGDPCYLPDGRIIFNSTRGFIAVPCHDGTSYVSNLCMCNADGSGTRMLTFDQESNWYPTVLDNGRVLYTRYEYANISHQFGRLLFHMNPDGTNQCEYYGSNSYWPNSIFYARPIPGHPSMVVGVVCGHHGPNRTGRLVLFDPARGRRETEGVVQTIPGWGKPVKRVVVDALYGGDWPKFVNPWPLSDKYYLASARLHPDQEEYALYLVDVFDNVTEIYRQQDCSLFEPIPIRRRKRPAVIPDRVVPGATEATVALSDVYEGRAMEGVPRGTVKRLRVFTYNYMYRDTNRRGFGHLATPGVDGPWEPRYILGTVPVREDGSALFTVPANTPISLQPIDVDGRAVQQMRSWFSAMPGEAISCVGCHEQQNTSPVANAVGVPYGAPDRIEHWRGKPRGFDFELEVQPVLDRFCVGCHDSSQPGRPDLSRKSDDEKKRINAAYHKATESTIRTVLTPSFIALHPYVRRSHSESNYSLQAAAEFCADTSPLVQMLHKGHHRVRLDADARDRLYTWIDLGAPDHGSWKYSEWGAPSNYYERRLAMLKQFANRADDVELLPLPPKQIPAFTPPPTSNPRSRIENPQGWPFDAAEAKRRQHAAGLPKTIKLDLADGIAMELVLVPAGEFVMGEARGPDDEAPLSRVRIDTPFYMSRCEVTNAQFRALADPNHNSGVVQWRSIDWRGEGYHLNGADQPTVRASWQQAMEFCAALSTKTGRRITLPTEAQWEWACRAGADTPLWYGGTDDDFSKRENLSGHEARRFAFKGKRKWYLRDDRFDDGHMVTAPVGTLGANAWGLHDMAGNVCEWTRTVYRPYPYGPSDRRENPSSTDDKVVRGGSWFDKPNRGRSAFRWKYPAWRRVHNVGFRVIAE